MSEKIGLLIIATNKYTEFLQPLIKSADEFFLKSHEVEYFIFTNKNDLNITSNRKVNYIQVDHREWPWMTLGRYKIFYENHAVLNRMDYLYYMDADMIIVKDINDEILGDLVVTQHPGYYGTRGTPEYRQESSAYISPVEKIQYFAGGFNGGKSDEFLKMSLILKNNIEDDYKKGIIAIWHDESHLNKYISTYKNNFKVLTPSYCYAQNMNLPFEKKIIAIVKEHEKYR